MEYLKVFAWTFGVAVVLTVAYAVLTAFGLGAVLKVLPIIPFLLFVAWIIRKTEFDFSKSKEIVEEFLVVLAAFLIVIAVLFSWLWTIGLVSYLMDK